MTQQTTCKATLPAQLAKGRDALRYTTDDSDYNPNTSTMDDLDYDPNNSTTSSQPGSDVSLAVQSLPESSDLGAACLGLPELTMGPQKLSIMRSFEYEDYSRYQAVLCDSARPWCLMYIAIDKVTGIAQHDFVHSSLATPLTLAESCILL